MSILEKHAQDNYWDKHWDEFESHLETTGIRAKGVPAYLLIRTRCESCDEEALCIKYHGRRILVVHVIDRLVMHQCPVNTRFEIGPEEGQTEPDPNQETYPDDPNVRDGSGRIRNGGWHDEYPDDPYSYPDIPYVDPTRGVKR